MKLTNGTSLFPWTGVFEVEFWNSIFQSGRDDWKKSTKCLRTALDPSVPGTRVRRIGERRPPVWMSKSVFGRGSNFNVSFEISW